jgi:hypothetical protein
VMLRSVDAARRGQNFTVHLSEAPANSLIEG